MNEGDNVNSRLYDTDSSDITFYSAASSPDVSWDSFTTDKIDQSYPTVQSNRPTASSDSTFDWFETFFDPASAVCDIDAVFEDMDHTLSDTESTLIKSDSRHSDRLKPTALELDNKLPEEVSTPDERLDFDMVLGNSGFSMNPFRNTLQDKIVDELTPARWNLAASSENDKSRRETFDDIPVFRAESSTIADSGAIPSESSSFSKYLPSATDMDLLTTGSESEHTLVLTPDITELAYKPDVIESALDTDYLTPSVSPDITTFTKANYELGGACSIKPFMTTTIEHEQSEHLCHLPSMNPFNTTFRDTLLDSATNVDIKEFDPMSLNQFFPQSQDGCFHEQLSKNNENDDVFSMDEKNNDASVESTLKAVVLSLGLKHTLETSDRPKLTRRENQSETQDPEDIPLVAEASSVEVSDDSTPLQHTRPIYRMTSFSDKNENLCKQRETEAVEIARGDSPYMSRNVQSRNSLISQKSSDSTKGPVTKTEIQKDKLSFPHPVDDHKPEDSQNKNAELTKLEKSLSEVDTEKSSFDCSKFPPFLLDSCEGVACISTRDTLNSSNRSDITITNITDSLNSAIASISIDESCNKTNNLHIGSTSPLVELQHLHQSTQNISETVTTKVRCTDILEHTNNLETSSITTSTDIPKHLINIEMSNIYENTIDSCSDWCVLSLNQPISANAETSSPKSDTRYRPTKTNSAPFMRSRDAFQKQSESSSSQEKTDPLSKRHDSAEFLIPGNAIKKMPRRNSYPSATSNASFPSSLSGEGCLVLFKDVALVGKRPISGDMRDQVSGELRTTNNRRSLSNSSSEPNFHSSLREGSICLPKNAWSLSNLLRRDIDPPKTVDDPGRFISIQSRLIANEVESEQIFINEDSSSGNTLQDISIPLSEDLDSSHICDDPVFLFPQEIDTIQRVTDLKGFGSNEKPIPKTPEIIKKPDEHLGNSFTCNPKPQHTLVNSDYGKNIVKSEIEIFPEASDSASTSLPEASRNVSKEPVISFADIYPMEKLNSSSTDNGQDIQDLTKSVITEVMKAQKRDMEGEIRSDDFSEQETTLKQSFGLLADSFSLEKLNKDKLINIKRSASLSGIMKPLNPADFSQIKPTCTKDQHNLFADQNESLKHSVDSCSVRGRISSGKEAILSSSDETDFVRLETASGVGKDSKLSITDTALPPGKISDTDRDLRTPTVIKHQPGLTQRNNDTTTGASGDRTQHLQISSISDCSGEALKSSDQCRQLETKNPFQFPIGNSETPDKEDIRRKEIFLHPSETAFSQELSSGSYFRETEKFFDALTTQDELKESAVSKSSQDIIAPAPISCSLSETYSKHKSEVDQITGFVLSETNQPDSDYSDRSVDCERLKLFPRLNHNTDDKPVNKMCNFLLMLTEESKSCLEPETTDDNIFAARQHSDTSHANQAPVSDTADGCQKPMCYPVKITSEHDLDFIAEAKDKDKTRQTESDTNESVETLHENLADYRSLPILEQEARLPSTVDDDLSHKSVLSEVMLTPVSNRRLGSTSIKLEAWDANRNYTLDENDQSFLICEETRSKSNLASEREYKKKTLTPGSDLTRGSTDDDSLIGEVDTPFETNQYSFETANTEKSTPVLSKSEWSLNYQNISIEKRSKSFPVLSVKYSSHSKVQRTNLIDLNKDKIYASADTVQGIKTPDFLAISKFQMEQPSLSGIQLEETSNMTVKEPSIQDIQVTCRSKRTITLEAERQTPSQLRYSESQFPSQRLEQRRTDLATTYKERSTTAVEARPDVTAGYIIPSVNIVSPKWSEDVLISPECESVAQEEGNSTCVVLEPKSASSSLPSRTDSSEENICDVTDQDYVLEERANENRLVELFSCCCCYLRVERSRTASAESSQTMSYT
ncbi:unnamed protein product [Acanthosepion pharaonis]|uniref:Uncharacterized protein n=1 Tax=Acanthosepion pharaonis TaxID=158019 RepID=A0A812BAC1_ACAPH|nr:unnamed protein product [Sepia pharaonis]